MRPSDRHDCQRKPVYLNDQRRKTICSTVMRHQSFSALRIAAVARIKKPVSRLLSKKNRSVCEIADTGASPR